MTEADVCDTALQAKDGRRCALDFARGWKINLGRADPDSRQRAAAFDALRDALDAANVHDGYRADALELFAVAWERARHPLGVSMGAAVDFARRTAALPWTYPDGCASEERRAIWRAVCFFYHVADGRAPGSFIFPVAQYEEATGGGTDRQTAHRFLHMLCQGSRAALHILKSGKSNREGRGRATTYGMTAEGLRFMPDAAFFDGAAGSGRTCPTGAPPPPAPLPPRAGAEAADDGGDGSGRTCPTGYRRQVIFALAGLRGICH